MRRNKYGHSDQDLIKGPSAKQRFDKSMDLRQQVNQFSLEEERLLSERIKALEIEEKNLNDELVESKKEFSDIFEKVQDYQDLVALSDQLEGFSKPDFISLDQDLKSMIDKAIIKVRTSYPAIEGVQSKILRTAILQRLVQS